jgi:hypothetical protein
VNRANPWSDEQRAWFNRLRAEWFRVMRPLGSWVPWELRDLVALDEHHPVESGPRFWGDGLMTPADDLTMEHLANCRVVPNRDVLLRYLPQHGVVAEVGTLHGEFAKKIVQFASPRQLHIIDHELQPGARLLATDATLDGRVVVHEGDSVEVLSGFEDEYFDWIYIDAQHDYDGVSRDIAVARRKVKHDGLLVFNDYTPWSYVEMQPYGIVAAVNELCQGDGWEFVYLALPGHMYCDVAIRRRRFA